MKPPIPLTDPRFKYTPAEQTNLRLTFARIRRELGVVEIDWEKLLENGRIRNAIENSPNVSTLPKAKGKK